MAADATYLLARHDLHGRGHPLQLPPLGIEGLKIDLAQRRDQEPGRAVLLDRHLAPATLRVVGAVAHHGRLVVGPGIQVGRLAHLLHDPQILDPAAGDGRFQAAVDVDQQALALRCRSAGIGEEAGGALRDLGRPSHRTQGQRKIAARARIVVQEPLAAPRVEQVDAEALHRAAPVAAQERLLVQRERIAIRPFVLRVADAGEFPRNVRKAGAPGAFRPGGPVDQADRPVRIAVMRGEGGDGPIAAPGQRTRLPERGHVADRVAEIELVEPSVGILRPQALAEGQVAIDVFPAGEQHAAVGQHLGAEVGERVHAHAAEVAAVGRHAVQVRTSGPAGTAYSRNAAWRRTRGRRREAGRGQRRNMARRSVAAGRNRRRRSATRANRFPFPGDRRRTARGRRTRRSCRRSSRRDPGRWSWRAVRRGGDRRCGCCIPAPAAERPTDPGPRRVAG